MKRNNETSSIKEVLNSFFNQKQINQGVVNSKIGIAWKKTAGNQLSKYTKDIYLKNMDYILYFFLIVIYLILMNQIL